MPLQINTIKAHTTLPDDRRRFLVGVQRRAEANLRICQQLAVELDHPRKAVVLTMELRELVAALDAAVASR